MVPHGERDLLLISVRELWAVGPASASVVSRQHILMGMGHWASSALLDGYMNKQGLPSRVLVCAPQLSRGHGLAVCEMKG